MDAIDTWKRAGALADPQLAASVLATDAVLVSPLTTRFTFCGPAEIEELLAGVFEILGDYRYERDMRGDGEAFLSAWARVRGVDLHELQHLELAGDGTISRITIAMRPLVALTAFAREIGPVMARRQGSSATARKLALAGALLDSVAGTGDRKFIPLAAPRRVR